MKINIGRQASGKKYLHPLSRSGVTTSSFGFVQPIQCRELIPQDHVSLRCANLLRLQPLVKPTFGRVEIKTYHGFVPIADIYHPFESLLAGKTYNGANASYIPQYVPFTQEAILAFSCYLNSDIQLFEPSGSNGWLTDNDGIGSLDPLRIASNPTAAQTAFDTAFKSYIEACFTNGQVNQTKIGYIMSYWRNNINEYSLLMNPSITKLEQCDWFFVVRDSNNNVKYLAGGSLTEAGKNLQKILLGCGYNLNLGCTEDKSILKLCAYYKFWFDTFAVQRTVTWKQTNCYKLLEYLEQYGQNDINQMIGTEQTSATVLATWFKFVLDLTKCYYTQSPDYVSAHITGTAIENGDSDSFSYAMQFTSSSGVGIGSVNTKNAAGNAQDGQPNYVPTRQIYSGQNFQVISQTGLDVLKQLYKYVNIKTAVGGKIAAFMHSIFGSDYRDEKESNFIGVHTSKVDISPVMSTAETAQGYLGEFAGQGFGGTAGEKYDFTASCAGYLLTMIAIVPDSKFAQGDDPDTNHLKKFDFFTPQFDALTLLPTRKSSIYNCFALTDPDVAHIGFNQSFGNIPNYTEYKVERDLVSGELALLSKQANLLPFNLSKILPYTRILQDEVRNLKYSGLVAGEVWRYIGLYRQIGNFDRIFVNSGFEPSGSDTDSLSWLYKSTQSDNFIVYFYIDLNVHSVALPVSQSFQTDGFQDSIKVEKA